LTCWLFSLGPSQKPAEDAGHRSASLAKDGLSTQPQPPQVASLANSDHSDFTNALLRQDHEVEKHLARLLARSSFGWTPSWFPPLLLALGSLLAPSSFGCPLLLLLLLLLRI
jgi:hypothetical protein